MKRMLGFLLVSLSITASAADQSLSVTEALETFQRIIIPTESAGGFYATETPKMRDFSPDVPITVDTKCLHFAIVTGRGDKPVCRKHADIKKLSIGKVNRDSVFGKASKGDYEIVVFYKGFGKLIILNVGPDDIDPFINAVRVLSPSLKKIKDPR